MSQTAECIDRSEVVNAYDYTHQAWVAGPTAGELAYQRCGHPEEMDCGCFGRLHQGEKVSAETLTALWDEMRLSALERPR